MTSVASSKPLRSAGWFWPDLYNIEWEPRREVQNKNNSLHSRQAPTQFSPDTKLSMKNNVRSSRNKISGTCLTLDLESGVLGVLSTPIWHRHHRLFLLMSRGHTQACSSLCYLFYVEGRELLTLPATFQSPSSQSKEIRRKWNNVPCIQSPYVGKKNSIQQKLIHSIF